MHLAEGVLSPPVLAAGTLCAAAGIAVGLRKLDADDMPRAAVLASAFFAASLIHVPLGPVSVHLVLNGLLGLLLGWAAFPVIAAALLLQTVFFGYGGITVLGVNTCVMALPAVACHYLVRGRGAASWQRSAFARGAGAGTMAVVLSSGLIAVALVVSGKNLAAAAAAMAAANLPLMVIEAGVTGSATAFLARVRPETFETAPSNTAPEQTLA